MTFQDREKGFENRYVHDEEQRFRIESRRNRLVAAWAAERLGRTGEAGDAYAREIAAIGSSRDGAAAIAQRLAEDFGAAGMSEATAEIEPRMKQLRDEAERQVTGE